MTNEDVVMIVTYVLLLISGIVLGIAIGTYL